MMKAITKLWPVTLLVAGVAAQGPAVSENVYFGDLHLHTRYSNDAASFGTTRTPDDAYRYAKGEAVPHVGGIEIQLRTPLDFLAVTDHAENIGRRQAGPNPPPNLGQAVWADIVAAAVRHYAPGEFTTFAAYEWTVGTREGNLHRNVIFAGTDDLPFPFSRLDSDNPEDLWDFLDTQRAAGVEAMAIPHNSNVSNGKMFALVDFAGAPMTADYAAQRLRNEPVVEITQAKGTSETHPVLSPNDEFADFELFPELLLANRPIGGDGPRAGVGRVDGLVPGSYVREALVNGVRMQADRGFNPFQFGFVGATDFHSGTSAVEEDNMTSLSGNAVDGTLEERLVTNTWSRLPFVARSAAGLTAAWANENTREDLYAAFRRRETYATTGTRITVRFFGGWDYADDVLDGDDWVAQGYAGGVPMGGVLRGAEGGAPTFVIRAAKDPVAANLDRIQVVKGWSAEGETFERIYDVALSDGRRVGPTGKAPPVGNTVDVMRATYTNDIGAASLEAVWRDPDFDPDVHAVYYVRVIEIPTPRWSTYDTAAAGLPPRGDVMPTLQERAYTSPIWYMPGN